MNALSTPIGASRQTGQWPDGAAFSGDEYCPIAEAKISVLDWGFTRSDVCYDVVHVKDGAFFRRSHQPVFGLDEGAADADLL
ncbi:MAG: hypothetical protein O3B74_09960 [Proteobacteria bacterium]|nr:hypothetical protein [Pseudomonadota bacterium]